MERTRAQDEIQATFEIAASFRMTRVFLRHMTASFDRSSRDGPGFVV